MPQPRTTRHKAASPTPYPHETSSSASRASSSFFTALATPTDPTNTTVTAISSPLEAKAEPEPEPEPKPRYRNARPLPMKLEMKTEVPLEEGVDYAIQFLGATLNASAPPKPVYVAPPKQLALLATYAIHPKYTTHPEEADAVRLSGQAVQYLRNVLRMVGPVNARLDLAFAFMNGSDSDTDSQDGTEPLHCALARGGSIWQRAPNFWATLGWAFNCSVSYPQRWKFWKAWLELMVEVLKSDLEERDLLDQLEGPRAPLEDVDQIGSSSTPHPTPSSAARNDYPMLEGSILYMYKSGIPMKELLRALTAFTDGDNPADRGSFSKVFSRELAMEKTEEKRVKMQKLDLENDIFGDYAIKQSDSSDDEAALGALAPRSRKRRRADTRTNEVAATLPFSIEERVAETVPIRLHLFGLLSWAFYRDPNSDLHPQFYEEFCIRVRQLPLDIFRLFIQPQGTPLDHFTYASFVRYIIVMVTPDSLPTADDWGITYAMCERCFAPFAAGKASVEDNAKYALVLEAMLQHIIANYREQGSFEECSETFREAIETGIAARRDRTKPKMRGGRLSKENPSEQAARKVLEQSEANLRMLVDIIEDVD